MVVTGKGKGKCVFFFFFFRGNDCWCALTRIKRKTTTVASSPANMREKIYLFFSSSYEIWEILVHSDARRIFLGFRFFSCRKWKSEHLFLFAVSRFARKKNSQKCKISSISSQICFALPHFFKKKKKSTLSFFSSFVNFWKRNTRDFNP